VPTYHHSSRASRIATPLIAEPSCGPSRLAAHPTVDGQSNNSTSTRSNISTNTRQKSRQSPRGHRLSRKRPYPQQSLALTISPAQSKPPGSLALTISPAVKLSKVIHGATVFDCTADADEPGVISMRPTFADFFCRGGRKLGCARFVVARVSPTEDDIVGLGNRTGVRLPAKSHMLFIAILARHSGLYTTVASQRWQ